MTTTTATNPSAKPLPTELFVFIDALGWRTVSRTGFLADLLPERRPLGMQFGYSCTAIPTLLSGRRPSEHGHLGLFVYDPAHSPFRWLSRLAPLFRPRSLWNRGRVRHWLSRLVRLVYGYTGYFQLYRMPLEKLGFMDYGEKRDLFAAHGLAPFDNLHDVLARTTLPWHISNWRHGDQASPAAAEAAPRRASYSPWDIHPSDAEIRRALDNIRLNAFSLRCPGVFDPILRALLDHGDYYMLLADLRDYIRAQEEMQAQYADQELWTRKALVNIARSGKFSSDRTISEYATEIWHLDPYRG